ncbi:MAG: hypothetical protein JNL23_12975, partial [Chitinophagaceae bacterium]|nr:hypothetical protein [Chitinophagaceae bacterium]
PVLFLDAYERMPYESIFSLNPGRCRVVYLDEVPVEGLTMDDMPALKKKLYKLMEEKLIQYNVSWLNKQTDKKTTICK